jgi:hypothetical protein
MNYITSCIACKHIIEAGKSYWHLQKCPEYQEYKRKRDA